MKSNRNNNNDSAESRMFVWTLKWGQTCVITVYKWL